MLLLLLGEFDDQHGVLDAHARQHDEADLREDVVVHVPLPKTRGDSAQQGTSGTISMIAVDSAKALILGRVGQEDEQHAEGEDPGRRGAAGSLSSW
jgi:hypothetical protein